MKKFRVYGIMTASILVGEYEANTEEEAHQKANEDPDADWSVGLCHYCAGQVDIGEIYETRVEKVKD